VSRPFVRAHRQILYSVLPVGACRLTMRCVCSWPI
jgi:hypothetical protein